MGKGKSVEAGVQLIEERLAACESVMKFMIDVMVDELSKAEQIRKLAVRLATSMRFQSDGSCKVNAVRAEELKKFVAGVGPFSKPHKKAVAWAVKLKAAAKGSSTR